MKKDTVIALMIAVILVERSVAMVDQVCRIFHLGQYNFKLLEGQSGVLQPFHYHCSCNPEAGEVCTDCDQPLG